MQEETVKADEESWTQTLITITPQEDAGIRTITETTLISGVSDTPLVLGVDNVIIRSNVQLKTIRRDLLITIAELEKRISCSDAGCQTYLRGVPKVELLSQYKDKATQTMYLGRICLHDHNFEDIARIMNDRIIPVAEKITEITQTVIKFDAHTSNARVIDRLTKGVATEDLLEDYNIVESAEANAYVTDIFYHIMNRVFWLSDPGCSFPEIKLKHKEIQTCIKCYNNLGKIVLDADTQTILTCEPRQSNTNLLTEWTAVRSFLRDIIEECVENGIRPLVTADVILHDVVERCAGQIRLPYRDEMLQTLASCQALEGTNDEILRKLRLDVIVDTFESSVIALSVVGVLLCNTYFEIHQKAPTVVADIINRLLKKSVFVAEKVAAIRQEGASRKPLDDVLAARTRRLRDLLENKTVATLSTGTQTGLAGVPDLIELNESKRTTCSTCVRRSECSVCVANGDKEWNAPSGVRREEIHGKILRTQDILLAYNPCYVMATPSKISENQSSVTLSSQFHTVPISASAKRTQLLLKANLRASISSSTSSSIQDKPQAQRQESNCIRPLNTKLSAAGSLEEWGKVVQVFTFTPDAWSVCGPSRCGSGTVINRYPISSLQISGIQHKEECTRSGCNLPIQSIKALRILKNIFNRKQGSCSNCTCNPKGGQGSRGITSTTLPPAVICSKSSGITKEESKDEVQALKLCERKSRELDSGKKPYRESLEVVPIIRLPSRKSKS
ncbi:uncharacterized protein LOC124302659 [Neodiprion virginianus]|uniref:uncharacterized protein LOC124302659 n=1 Tax=Neodiprion virginianus TaxID=2961670 RepID=UPI001EE767D2|nr:uncharacterized protein LOC124302659 [Neodiprion virginianus]